MDPIENVPLRSPGSSERRMDDVERGETVPTRAGQFAMLLPHLWPRGKPMHRVRLVLSLVLMVVGRIANISVPLALKAAVDQVTLGRVPVVPVILYGSLRFLADTCKELRDILFSVVGAEATRSISLDVFNHVQHLSVRFHLARKTGAVLRGVSRGAQSFADILRYVVFQLAPVFLEVLVVCGILLYKYSWYFGVLTFTVVAFYVAFTFTTTEWRNRFRRQMNEKDDQFNQKALDSLINFETVKYFNAEEHMKETYNTYLKEYQTAILLSQQSLSLLNIGQNAIVSLGVGLAMLLAGRQVVSGTMGVGDFVLVNVYILQLYVPLNFLGTYYRLLKQCFVDVEALYKLMSEDPDIKDVPEAQDIIVPNKGASVAFDDVKFAYQPEVPILKGLTFVAKPGTKVAIVGATGAGKSTISKLLYRFYDATEGCIKISGQDIRYATQSSVRDIIGIVPQDCVLFNDTIRYNIGFGRVGKLGKIASNADIERVAKAAQIDVFIKGLPEGYDTVVGERGLRLSGGEKQRVAIARALLKEPPIMVYDEATSSLDTKTEKEIQAAMDLAAKGRTSIIIAHRLSTIMDADEIIVLDGGRIVEQGRHRELFNAKGKYRDMWEKQSEFEGGEVSVEESSPGNPAKEGSSSASASSNEA